MEFKTRLIRSFKMFLTFSACFLLVLAVALEDNSTKRSAGEQESEKYNVLILGAGMAGISAAKTLYDAGIRDFRVLEASERIGGRLLATKFDGAYIELGGNWVHGTENNPIWTLVQQAELGHVDTMIEPTECKYIVLDENGADVTSKDGHEEMESANDCIEERIVKERKKDKPDDFSVRDGLTKCGWKPQHPAQTSIEYYDHDFDAAVPPEEISCGVNLRSESDCINCTIDSTGGRQVLISDPKGYASIISNMAEEFKNNVLYEHLVKQISWKTGEVTVKVGMEPKLKIYKADFVLVTFSIGVLREQLKFMFKPALPQPFQQSLGKIEMANYLKIFMKFSERFWPPQYDYIFYASQDPGFYPVWQNLPGSQTGIPENDKILLVTVTGKKARELRGIEIKEAESKLVPVLEKVFANSIKGFKNPPELRGIKLNNWELDPLFRGAYSNPVVGITSDDFNTLLKPVGGKLFFAGEGLSELYYGFLHGAYLTGEEQAKKIIGVIQYQNSLTDSFPMQKIGLNYALRKSIGKPGNRTEY